MKFKVPVLPVVTILIVAAVLFGASAGLSDLRAANIQKEHIYMMQTVLPGSTEFVREPYSGEDVNVRTVHKAENGFVIETTTYGYAGEIDMMIGVSNEGTVTGLVIRDMEETLGLGRNALTDADFLAQFLDTAGNVAIATSGEDAFSGATGEADAEAEVMVDAVTGATVTSKAIARSINSAVAVVTGADAASSATTWGG
ncbi:MAG: FMN-binding protein [Clostridia bacterium]|nr:FMN-binding protein [Clostridia bacterium]